MADYLRKYGVASTINFSLIEIDGIDFRIDAVAASGDTKIMKDEGAEANTANNFVDEGQIYSLALTAAELTAARVAIMLVDSATKAWLDRELIIETYGNASAQHAQDFDTTVPTVTEIRQEMDSDSVKLTQISGDLLIVSGDVVSTLEDTGTTIPASLTIIDTEVGLISGDVALILVDTADMQPKIGTPVADISADLVVIKDDVQQVSGDIVVIDTEVGLISGDVATILVDTNQTQGKLPDNNIMGSSVTTDKDDEIDNILTEVRHISGDLLIVSGDVVTIDNEVGLVSGDVANIDTKTDDIQGAGFASGDDSLAAIRIRGDAAWTTGAGGSSPTVEEIRQEMDTNSEMLGQISGDLLIVSGDVVVIDTEVGLISGDVANILVDTNETQGKLPTNRFMGSSDGADDNTTLDSILSEARNTSGDVVTLQTDMTTTLGEVRHISGDVIVVSGDVVSLQSDMTTTLAEARHISGDLTIVSGDVVVVDTEIGLISGDVIAIKTKTDNLPEGIQKNVALAGFEFFMAQSGDHVTGATGESVTGQRSIDTGAFENMANSVSEISNGIYAIDLAQADTNGDVITYKFTSTGSDATLLTIKTVS